MTEVYIYDDHNPEDSAMLQALYSRSPDSVVNHIKKIQASGSGSFMSKFYVGYGHASIGDCGTTNIYIENVSMLVAKAFQDNPLYSGQEASTRYLDFSKQGMVDPFDTKETTKIQNNWLQLYTTYLPIITERVGISKPFIEGEYPSKRVWQNAVEARAFDIMRGFIPIGTKTYLSWTTNLRQAREKLMKLKYHPLQEVRTVALDVFGKLKDKYPNSFNGDEMSFNAGKYGHRDIYNERNTLRDNYLVDTTGCDDIYYDVDSDLIDIKHCQLLEKYELNDRPFGASLPKRLERYGIYSLYFNLDFGSFRDLQRHRNGLCQNPLPDVDGGIHDWYMDSVKELLSNSEYAEFEEIVANIMFDISHVTGDDVNKQYLLPMGINCSCEVSYSLPQMVYVAELRSQKTVHSTLRIIAQKMGDTLKEDFPDMALYIDHEDDNWTSKRGEQTIIDKENKL